jgi:hypothetical protein
MYNTFTSSKHSSNVEFNTSSHQTAHTRTTQPVNAKHLASTPLSTQHEFRTNFAINTQTPLYDRDSQKLPRETRILNTIELTINATANSKPTYLGPRSAHLVIPQRAQAVYTGFQHSALLHRWPEYHLAITKISTQYHMGITWLSQKYQHSITWVSPCTRVGLVEKMQILGVAKLLFLLSRASQELGQSAQLIQAQQKREKDQ